MALYGNQINFIEHNNVCRTDLIDNQRFVRWLLIDVLSVNDSNNAVEAEQRTQFRKQKGIGNRPRIAHATGFDHHIFGWLRTFEELKGRPQQIIADRTADTTIGQRNGITLHINDKLRIDIDRAEIIDQHRSSPTKIGTQNPI